MELISETYKVNCPYCGFVTRVTVKPQEQLNAIIIENGAFSHSQNIEYSSYCCTNCERDVILPYTIYYCGISHDEQHIKNELIEISQRINKLCELF